MKILYELVRKSQNGDKDSTLEIIKQFMPLINKYSRKLSYYGSDTDLIICVIETLNKIPIVNNEDMRADKYIVSYINKSVKNQYIKLSKRYSFISNSETELNTDVLLDKYIEDNLDTQLFIKQLIDKLSKLQSNIIKDVYLNNIPVADIAKKLNISRQAVNQNKIKALDILRKEVYLALVDSFLDYFLLFT